MHCSFTRATRTGLEGNFIGFPLRKILSKVFSVYLNLSHDLNMLEMQTELIHKSAQCKWACNSLVNKTNRCTEFHFYWYYDSTCFG